MRICPSRSRIVALISPAFSSIRMLRSILPSRIACRVSRTQAGQSESVSRGQPSGGLDFSYDLSSGLSDHCGVHADLSLILLSLLKANQTPPAMIESPFSKYLTDACIPVPP